MRDYTDDPVTWGELSSLYHTGQNSSMYAFSSTGTVTEGLSCEIRSAMEIASKAEDGEEELAELKEFLLYAEKREKELRYKLVTFHGEGRSIFRVYDSLEEDSDPNDFGSLVEANIFRDRLINAE